MVVEGVEVFQAVAMAVVETVDHVVGTADREVQEEEDSSVSLAMAMAVGELSLVVRRCVEIVQTALTKEPLLLGRHESD